MRLIRILFASLVLIPFLSGNLFASSGPPDWVLEAAKWKAPEYGSKVKSVVLLQDESVVVDDSGKHTMRERAVVKILQFGDGDISAARTYDSRRGKIRDFQGWLIDPSGKTTTYGKERIVDAAVTGELYEELRVKTLRCGATPPGSVFAWEIVEEEKSIFTQYPYSFQERLPVLVSRLSVTLPAGWEFKTITLNCESIKAEETGSAGTWELRNLPYIEDEDSSPSLSALVPRILVSYFPPPENSAGLRGLKDWGAVSSWLSTLVDPPAAVTEAGRSKASQLISAASGDAAKIRAIAEFVQKLKYVSVQLNLTRGGGYTPRPADETLAKAYGDCKDKATLMRALLKAVGIESYLVALTSYDRTYVRPEWPSPMQFNHAIVAIRVSPEITGPMVIETKSLGRLLIFDPTDSITPFGDLPLEEQGGYGLIIAEREGVLIKMPATPVAANRIESDIEATVDLDGRVEARIARRYYGQSKIGLHAAERMGAAELRKRLEEYYARRLPSAALSGISTEGKPEESPLKVNLNLGAERFAQVLQGRLFVVRPGFLISPGGYSFPSKQRSTPIRLEGDLRRCSISIKLPEGFKIDEIPEPAKIESAYGNFETTWAVKDGTILMQESFEIRDTLAPVSAYQEVRDFFEKVMGAHNAPVVLLRQ